MDEELKVFAKPIMLDHGYFTYHLNKDKQILLLPYLEGIKPILGNPEETLVDLFKRLNWVSQNVNELK